MEEKLCKRDRFEDSGPRHLLHPEWSDLDQKRGVIACLVKSVTVLERERQLGNNGQLKLAPKWWCPFNYKLSRAICSTWQGSVIAAVFEWDHGYQESSSSLSSPLSSSSSSSSSLSSVKARPPDAPEVVFAFRGTMTHGASSLSDFMADASISLQVLHKTSRFINSYKEVSEAIEKLGPHKVCIAGHSLGAAMCLLIGRNLAKAGIRVDTHLFNPPFPTASFDKIFQNSALRNTVHNVRNFITVSMSSILQNDKLRKEDVSEFLSLQGWRPHLYINRGDAICCSYIDYFRVRSHKLESRHVTKASCHIGLAGLVASFGGTKPFHLVPSSCLYIIENNSQNFRELHGIQQWWSEEFQVSQHEINLGPNRNFRKFLQERGESN